MTSVLAGMLSVPAGMTGVLAGMLSVPAGMTSVLAGVLAGTQVGCALDFCD
eukprot:gene4078-6128_t